MNNAQRMLEDIGLTKSEAQVYLALLKVGPATKKLIVNEAGITPSKLYEIVDRLIAKGLASYVKVNKVLHFSASHPSHVLYFLEQKKKNITKQAKEFRFVLSQLSTIQRKEEPEILVYKGWKGMRTAYHTMLSELKKGQEYCVLGATKGEDHERVNLFFQGIHRERRKRGITIRVLVNRSDKKWVLKSLQDKKYDHIRSIKNIAPTEVGIWKNTVMIVMLTKVPVVTVMTSTYLAKSFQQYFDLLWRTSL